MRSLKVVFDVVTGILAIPAYVIGWMLGALIWHPFYRGFWQK